jgi:pimeloyl-ACP methyl ester carboxylesterase
MAFAQNGAVRVWYETAGDGPAMVLIHANPCDHRMWLFQTAQFSIRFRTIAVNLRAYGRSDKPLEAYGFDAVADDIRAVMEAEGVTQAVLVGASIGAKIAFRLAIDTPEVASALVLIGGNAFRGKSYDSRIAGYRDEGVEAYRAKHMEGLFAPGFFESEAGSQLCGMLMDDTDRLDGEAIARLFQAFDGVDLAADVPGLRLPVLIANGEHDISLEGATRTAALIPRAEHRVIPECGHLCNLEKPAVFNALVADFLAGHGLLPSIAAGE